jgi:hypothetical protein
MKPVTAVMLVIPATVLAWQLGGIVKTAIDASVTRVEATAHHDPAAGVAVALPGIITLNLPGGGAMACRLDVRSYNCGPAVVHDPIRGPR